MEKELVKSHTPGASVAVVRYGKIVVAEGYGFANVELHVPATADTVYGLLSVSKQFTSAAVLLLEREGKLRLDEPIGTYLPGSPEAWKAVTVRHLLNHTSGIPDYTDVHPFFEEIALGRTPDELLKPVREAPLMFSPGSKWRYSNSNYYLLGQIVERLGGKPWSEFLKERIFRPAGMGATRDNVPTDVVPNRSAGYHWLDENAARLPAFVTGYHGRVNVLQNAIYIHPSKMWAAGSLLSTVRDLAKWQIALDKGQILPHETVAAMEKAASLRDGTFAPYGIGNELMTVGKHRVAGHQGGGMAFNSTVLRFPDDHLSVIVLANQTSAPSRTLAMRIAALYLPDLDPMRVVPPRDPDPARTGRLRQFLVDAALGHPDESMFAPQAADLVAFVKRSAPQFLGELGKLKSFKFLSSESTNQRTVVSYRSVYEKKTILWRFTMTKDDHISNIEPVEQ
ncbi:penicillin-binding protein [Fimbriimonas ginsengisoli Gsoil 348]|uniref:Penicillin-binding protein n=1 Tax=Fimbriimonas ginsengisoli Gsoil 348 TaxID=661478 RepID=A0A068NSW7_FIMGI|nr:penicillin-binding protein [Fimbriimonas ginsengisoli Gsoil 348]